MLSISSAYYIDKYKLYVKFNNGDEGEINLEKMIKLDSRPIFKRLLDEDTFKNFVINRSTIVWFDELDIAPEYLYFLFKKEEPALQDRFKSWGYRNV